jgi:hypothetical protein
MKKKDAVPYLTKFKTESTNRKAQESKKQDTTTRTVRTQYIQKSQDATTRKVREQHPESQDFSNKKDRKP